MPDVLKEALLRPSLKKSNLDLIFKHYFPALNLSYIYKLIKWAVCNQLMNYTKETGNLEELQSAYRDGHSMESVLLKEKTDILNSMDKQKVTCLILLDLSAAFDMVSHDLLLNHHWYRFGVQGQVLEWICSYLASRTQKVKVGDYESYPVTLKQGVPQGSVLGLILFSLYTSPIGDICRKHNVNYHGCADDIKNYLSLSPNVPGNVTTCLTTLQNCIQDIQIWREPIF